MINRSRTPATSAVSAAVTAMLLLLGSSLAQEAAATPEGALSTASYGLFPIEGSAMEAQLQVTQRAEGGTRIVVSIPRTDSEATYRAAIYEGDCGPDRPLVLALAEFGLGGDPYVSETISEASFAAIAEGDHFAYLFRGDTIDTPEQEGLDADAVACGEVGAGANVGEN